MTVSTDELNLLNLLTTYSEVAQHDCQVLPPATHTFLSPSFHPIDGNIIQSNTKSAFNHYADTTKSPKANALCAGCADFPHLDWAESSTIRSQNTNMEQLVHARLDGTEATRNRITTYPAVSTSMEDQISERSFRYRRQSAIC